MQPWLRGGPSPGPHPPTPQLRGPWGRAGKDGPPLAPPLTYRLVRQTWSGPTSTPGPEEAAVVPLHRCRPPPRAHGEAPLVQGLWCRPCRQRPRAQLAGLAMYSVYCMQYFCAQAAMLRGGISCGQSPVMAVEALPWACSAPCQGGLGVVPQSAERTSVKGGWCPPSGGVSASSVEPMGSCPPAEVGECARTLRQWVGSSASWQAPLDVDRMNAPLGWHYIAGDWALLGASCYLLAGPPHPA